MRPKPCKSFVLPRLGTVDLSSGPSKAVAVGFLIRYGNVPTVQAAVDLVRTHPPANPRSLRDPYNFFGELQLLTTLPMFVPPPPTAVLGFPFGLPPKAAPAGLAAPKLVAVTKAKTPTIAVPSVAPAAPAAPAAPPAAPPAASPSSSRAKSPTAKARPAAQVVVVGPTSAPAETSTQPIPKPPTRRPPPPAYLQTMSWLEGGKLAPAPSASAASGSGLPRDDRGKDSTGPTFFIRGVASTSRPVISTSD